MVLKDIFENEEKVNIAAYLLKELKKTIIEILNTNLNANSKLSIIKGIKEEFVYMEDECYRNMESIFDIFDKYEINSSRFIISGNSDVYGDYTQTIAGEVDRYTTTVTKTSLTVEDVGFLLRITHLYRTYKYNINENNTSPLIGRFNANKKDFKTIFCHMWSEKRKCNGMFV